MADSIHGLLGRLADEATVELPPAVARETLLELRSHIEEARQARLELGMSERDAEAETVLAFGEAHRTIRDLAREHGRRWERPALGLALGALLLPVWSDLLMDASSWLTGSDHNLPVMAVPTAVLAGLFLRSCLRVRRVMAAPLLRLVAGTLLVSVVAGGWTRGVSGVSWSNTQARGTQARRAAAGPDRVLDSVANQVRQMDTAYRNGEAAVRAAGLSTIQGYPLPPDGRYVMDSVIRRTPDTAVMSLDHVPSFEVARRAWAVRGPATLASLDEQLRNQVEWHASALSVRDSSWLSTVRSDLPYKVTVAAGAAAALLLLNAVGVGVGAITRRQRRRMITR